MDGNQAILQNYEQYSDHDHATWAKLFQRQKKLHKNRLSSEYVVGFRKLQLDENRIANINETSRRLNLLTGWTLVPVTGLIPTKYFFYMIVNKCYPVTVTIRKPREIDFSEQPDIFHDVCGHLPLLTNEKFIKFLTTYSIIALKYTSNERAIELLGRLYWFTYEMGLIQEDGALKAYGGAIITSSQEVFNVDDPSVPKYDFDLDHVLRTPYNPFVLQKNYFTIKSFDELFGCLENLESKLIEHLLLPEQDHTLRNYSLNPFIGREFNNGIDLLNTVHLKFPEAISFVAGQPDEEYFNVTDRISKLQTFIDYLAKKEGKASTLISNRLGQYSRTKGIINDVIVEYLRTDENLFVKEEHILMTVGAQEAFAIIVSTICSREKDVILVENPSYIGLSAFSMAFGYEIIGVPTDDEGIDLVELRKKIISLNESGKNVKILYVIPDYQNPTGSCMPIGSRLKLLELAQSYNFLIIEDCVYNSFAYAQKNPTLKSLDRFKKVILVGSFSKLLFPALRVGFIICDQTVENSAGNTVLLIDEMIKIKAQLTNNTSAIDQGIVAGVLIDLGYSLSKLNVPKFLGYKRKRDLMISALNKWIRTEEWSQGIRWSEPEGGFFVRMWVPFQVDYATLLSCATKWNVLFCPMQYFYVSRGGENEIRLAFSNLSYEQIDDGVRRLAGFLKSKTCMPNHVLNEVHSA